MEKALFKRTLTTTLHWPRKNPFSAKNTIYNQNDHTAQLRSFPRSNGRQIGGERMFCTSLQCPATWHEYFFRTIIWKGGYFPNVKGDRIGSFLACKLSLFPLSWVLGIWGLRGRHANATPRSTFFPSTVHAIHMKSYIPTYFWHAYHIDQLGRGG